MDDYQVHNIALKTLKQRCEYLQQRLNAVEEENCKLKLEKAQDLKSKTSKDLTSLEERVIILNEEKSQMAHKIQMITSENLALWSQLFQLLPGNQISSLKYSVSAPPDKQMLKFSDYDNTSKELSCDDKESLEEISLKLINGIIMGKNELEKQYSQMVDLQKEDVSYDQDSVFVPKQFDKRAAVKNLKNYVQKLNDFKQTLYQQKNDLSSAITIIKNSKLFSEPKLFLKGNVSNSEHYNFSKEIDITTNPPENDFPTLQDNEINGFEKLSGNELICPFCGLNFNSSFKNLEKHVAQHLGDDNDEFEDAIANSDNI